MIQRESYVKIPAGPARDFGLVRGTHYTAHFTDGRAPLPIKAAGNGPERDGVRYAKQFEGVGRGACKAFTPWYQSGGVNGVMINKDAWNQLPEEYQNAIQMAAEICTSEQLSRYLWMDFDSTKKMLEEDGCVVTKMNQDDWNTIRETCRQVYEEEAAKNENFNMVYSSMQDYREHADTYRAMLGDYGWGFNYDESEK